MHKCSSCVFPIFVGSFTFSRDILSINGVSMCSFTAQPSQCLLERWSTYRANFLFKLWCATQVVVHELDRQGNLADAMLSGRSVCLPRKSECRVKTHEKGEHLSAQLGQHFRDGALSFTDLSRIDVPCHCTKGLADAMIQAGVLSETSSRIV